MFWVDQDQKLPRRLRAGEAQLRLLGLRPAEAVIEAFPNDGPSAVGVGQKVVELQHAGVVLAPLASRAAGGRMPLSMKIPAPMKAVSVNPCREGCTHW